MSPVTMEVPVTDRLPVPIVADLKGTALAADRDVAGERGVAVVGHGDEFVGGVDRGDWGR